MEHNQMGRMEAEHEHEMSKLEEQLRIKQLFIDDAKAKIHSINMEYFGMSSEKLSDLKIEIEKMAKQVEDIADIVTLFLNDQITKEEARTRVNEVTNRC